MNTLHVVFGYLGPDPSTFDALGKIFKDKWSPFLPNVTFAFHHFSDIIENDIKSLDPTDVLLGHSFGGNRVSLSLPGFNANGIVPPTAIWLDPVNPAFWNVSNTYLFPTSKVGQAYCWYRPASEAPFSGHTDSGTVTLLPNNGALWCHDAMVYPPDPTAKDAPHIAGNPALVTLLQNIFRTIPVPTPTPTPTPIVPPDGPYGLSASLSTNIVSLNWSGKPGNDGYRLVRNGVVIATTTNTVTTSFDNLTAPGTYIYQVKGFNSMYESGLSNSVTIVYSTTPTPTPTKYPYAGTVVTIAGDNYVLTAAN
jgi:hypothetical protein